MNIIVRVSHCCPSHQNCEACLLIWWRAPYIPYEKGVNKTHIGNIKQGQGRQFGWRPFFKCGKQKNKIVLAVTAVWKGGFGWRVAANTLLPVSCVHQNHSPRPNTLRTVGVSSFGRAQRTERKVPNSVCSGEWRDETVGGVGKGWSWAGLHETANSQTPQP